MKIKIWTAITDSGDGEHHSHTYKTKEELVSDLKIDVDYLSENDGAGFDKYGYYVSFSCEIFDTDGYEVVG